MEITKETFNNINKLDEIFSTVETLSRVLTTYDDTQNKTENNDKANLINLLHEHILVMKEHIDKFTDSLLKS